VLCPRRYENIVQIRALYEGVGVQEMLDTWHKMLPKKMKEWGLDRQEVGILSSTSRHRVLGANVV
jgi:hypothetical protein